MSCSGQLSPFGPGTPLTSGGYNLTPYFPPISPYVMPVAPMDQMIAKYGTDLNWQKSNACPCVYGGPIAGSPDPACTTCFGKGWYWNAPSSTFRGLITFIHMSPTPDEPGTIMSDKWGAIQMSEPTLTLTYNNASAIWNQASEFDIYTQVNAIDRYMVSLVAGRNQTVPYQQNLTIPATGAVTVYDNVNKVVDTVVGYTVSGATVVLPSTYASGTSYIVTYTAAKAFVAWRSAGTMAHDRPFGNLELPKRFRLQSLDLWLRNTGKM